MFAGFTTLTWIHTLLSIAALIAGVRVMMMLTKNRRPDHWTLAFLVTAIATNVTAFGFPFSKLLPSHIIAVISLVFLALALLAQYVFHFAGVWRWIYAVSMGLAVYFNFFVLIAQLFAKVPALNALAPTQGEPPFALAQLVLLAIFLWLIWQSVRNFRGAAAA
jgi:hypothetical protein